MINLRYNTQLITVQTISLGGGYEIGNFKITTIKRPSGGFIIDFINTGVLIINSFINLHEN